MIKNNLQFKSIIKLNNHKWKGGTPNFHISLPLNMIEILVIPHDILIIRIILTKRTTEANDWIKKYFILNIFGALFFSPRPIIGTKSSNLNSMNLQIIKGLLRDSPTIEVVINNEVKTVFLNQAIPILYKLFLINIWRQGAHPERESIRSSTRPPYINSKE